MKKILLLACAVFALASCVTTVKTGKINDTKSQLLSATVADLEVSPVRVSHTLATTAKIRRAGLSNIKQAAIQECLQRNGNADVLVDAEYVIEKTNYFFFKRVELITVSGHPARFTGFHSLNDSVWCNPIFRMGYKDSSKHPSSGLLSK